MLIFLGKYQLPASLAISRFVRLAGGYFLNYYYFFYYSSIVNMQCYISFKCKDLSDFMNFFFLFYHSNCLIKGGRGPDWIELLDLNFLWILSDIIKWIGNSVSLYSLWGFFFLPYVVFKIWVLDYSGVHCVWYLSPRLLQGHQISGH